MWCYLIAGRPEWWDAGKNSLEDSFLGPVLKEHPEGGLVGKGDLFRTFVNAIVGQQISVIAADAIWNRLVEKVGEITQESNNSPAKLLLVV